MRGSTLFELLIYVNASLLFIGISLAGVHTFHKCIKQKGRTMEQWVMASVALQRLLDDCHAIPIKEVFKDSIVFTAQTWLVKNHRLVRIENNSRTTSVLLDHSAELECKEVFRQSRLVGVIIKMTYGQVTLEAFVRVLL